MPSCRGSSRRRDGTCASCVSGTVRRIFTTEPAGKPEALRPLMIKMHTASEKDGVSWSSDWDLELPMWRVQV